MFWKLCKHELKCSYRNFLFLYVAIMVAALLINPNNVGVLSTVASIIYGVMVFVLFIMCFVVIIRNYSNSMFSRNAYLTHTLPVSSTQLLLTKIIGAAFWSILSMFVFLISTFLLALRISGFDLSLISDLFNALIHTLSNWDTILGLLILFISTLEGVALIYLVMNITHTTHIQRFRPAIAVLLYILISWAVSFISGLVLAPMNANSVDISSMIVLSLVGGYSNGYETGSMIILIQSIILSVAYFFASKYIIDHKLEIE